ncbi:hypothetical protein [Bacteroides acidifaciens]|uniref:hypothetical protein n=1 Tax=Bacteroides acidifaciens TaxID=85831 RepID=UPI00259794F2|nr:hypothetical protein [Bacteroides acidifaciens]
MLGVKLQPESNKQVILNKQFLSKSFPTRNSDKMYIALQLYDEAYMIAREYFTFYYIMGTETIIEYVNTHEIGYSWEFLKNAIFDMGINALFRFYDKPSGKNNSKNEHVLWQCKQAFDTEVSSLKSSHITEITKHRHNNTAHCGNGFHIDSTSIKYDSPLIAIERLRQDRNRFDKEKLNSGCTIYQESLHEYFCSKIDNIIKILNSKEINNAKIANELKEYIDSVLSDNI